MGSGSLGKRISPVLYCKSVDTQCKLTSYSPWTLIFLFIWNTEKQKVFLLDFNRLVENHLKRSSL